MAVNILFYFQLVMCGVSLLVYMTVRNLAAATPPASENKSLKHQNYPVLTAAGMF